MSRSGLYILIIVVLVAIGTYYFLQPAPTADSAAPATAAEPATAAPAPPAGDVTTPQGAPAAPAQGEAAPGDILPDNE